MVAIKNELRIKQIWIQKKKPSKVTKLIVNTDVELENNTANKYRCKHLAWQRYGMNFSDKSDSLDKIRKKKKYSQNLLNTSVVKTSNLHVKNGSSLKLY